MRYYHYAFIYAEVWLDLFLSLSYLVFQFPFLSVPYVVGISLNLSASWRMIISAPAIPTQLTSSDKTEASGTWFRSNGTEEQTSTGRPCRWIYINTRSMMFYTSSVHKADETDNKHQNEISL